jgi:hypothetical protein
MSLSSRLPAFVVLGLVLIGAALLIAGYGPAVGVGVIVGLLLGLAVAIAIATMTTRGRSRRGVSGTWVTGLSRASSEPDHDLIMRHGREWMRVAGVDQSALRRVLGVGSSTAAAGVRLELIALEFREDGVIATLAAYTRPPVGALGHFAVASLADDVGTSYVAAAQATGSSGPETSRLDLRAAPAPPSSARALTLRFEQFADPWGDRTAELVGPWEFRVEL